MGLLTFCFLVLGMLSLVSAQPTIEPAERDALNVMAEYWNLRRHWNFSMDPCSPDAAWAPGNANPRISCDCTGKICHVTHLKIYALDIMGRIPKELFVLKELRDLNLGQNILSGSIPAEIGRLSKMQYLSLGINNLSGTVPPELGNLKKLISLSFSSNNFSGPLPTELGNLTSLEQLYIDSSGVSGDIPQELAKLKSLQKLWASDNLFTGKLPGFIGSLTKLTDLRLQGTSLEGPIPRNFGALTKLENLRIGDLMKEDSSLDFLENLTSLSILSLRNCRVSGQLSERLGKLTKLQYLDLSFNKLTGQIPISFQDLVELNILYLGNNNLNGELPSNIITPKLITLDVSFNPISGNLPQNFAKVGLATNVLGTSINANSLYDRKALGMLQCLQNGTFCSNKISAYNSFSVNCGGPDQISASGTEFDDDSVEIRRKVTTEIFKEAMRGGKFGITYSANLVSMLPDFIDHIMIEAAAMKQLPKFMHSTFNFRAKTFINNSNVVPLIRWLKHNSFTYPQIAKLICMSCGNLESIRDMAEWLKTIYVKGKYLGVVLVKAGGAVLERSTEELDEIVGYLEGNGVRKEWMGFVVSRCPQLLSCNMEEVRTRVNFYLDLGMNEMDFGTMVFDYPKALGFFTLEEMSCKVEYLKEFGLGNEDVGRLLAFKPQLMACSIEERWKPLVKYLYYLGVQRDGMRRILTLKPIVFCVDLEATIVPKVQFLQDIGVQEEAIGGVLVKFPSLITYSLYKKIRPVVIFLITKAGVTQRDIGKVIALGPELLGCSIAHKLEVNLKYLLSLGIPVRQLGEMVADFPMLLKYNLDVLRPKYHYLRRMMVRPLKDLIEFPRFFSYSLEGRIIPRHKIMVESRVNFKLRYMLASTDEVFDKRVGEAVERRRRFESAATNDPNFGTLSN